MTALAADRVDLQEADGILYSYPATTSAQFYKGSIVCVNTSTQLAVVGSTSTALTAVGVSLENRLAASGDEIAVRAGEFVFKNSAGADAISLDDVGQVCFIVDDQTVALLSAGGTRSVCGLITDVDTDGVWVFIHPRVTDARGTIKTWTATSDWEDAGTGTSTTHDISSGFPTNVMVLGAALEIDTAFAGEADAAVILGDTNDTNGLIEAFTLDSIAAGWATIVWGAESVPHFEAAYAPILTYTATELDDLTAGALTVHIRYIEMELAS
jgi:hypothetical protein